MLIFSLILNLVTFGLLLAIMPNISAVTFLAFALLIPFIYNGVLYIKLPHLKNDWVAMAMLSAITALAYGIFGYLTTVLDKIDKFVELNSYSNGVVQITIDANITSVSNVIFILLAQFGVLYIIRVIQNRRKT